MPVGNTEDSSDRRDLGVAAWFVVFPACGTDFDDRAMFLSKTGKVIDDFQMRFVRELLRLFLILLFVFDRIIWLECV